jgi:hypothetical protein
MKAEVMRIPLTGLAAALLWSAILVPVAMMGGAPGLESANPQSGGGTAGLADTNSPPLVLSGDSVTDATLDSIVQRGDLRRLTLTGTAVSDEGLKKLAGLKELRQLNLYSGVITDAGIAHLTALPKLEDFQLRASGVSDKSLRYLSQIKSLTRLEIWGNSGPGPYMGRQLFTIEGVLQLKSLPQLRELTINSLDAPGGFLGLRELKGLSSLTVDFSNIKDEEVELLKAAMPNTSVDAIREYYVLKPALPRAPLPSDSVYLSGRAVDDATGNPVARCQLQFGAPDPAKPGEMLWGEAPDSPPVEVSGNDPHDPSAFWGETFRTGKVWARILSGGFAPFLLTPNPALSPLSAPLRMTNIVARMKPGGDLRGVVLDYRGNPVPDMRAYLVDLDYFAIGDGKADSWSKSSPATTDAAGRFALAGGNGSQQKVAITSEDGQMVWVAPKVDPEHEARVTLPQPATLAVRYDIPGDLSTAQLFLNFRPPNPDSEMWKGVSFGLSQVLTNGEEIVLTNLTPGTYSLGRKKALNFGAVSRIAGIVRAESRFTFLDQQTFVLEPGRTQRVELVRPAGQSVRGEVTGIGEKGALGAYIYAYSGKTNIPGDMLGSGWPFDALTCGTNGIFQTAPLEPGSYTIVAMAYKEPDVYAHTLNPNFVGKANVTVTTNAAPPPVKIELVPRESWTKKPVIN